MWFGFPTRDESSGSTAAGRRSAEHSKSMISPDFEIDGRLTCASASSW
jgi:hypothetical protein